MGVILTLLARSVSAMSRALLIVFLAVLAAPAAARIVARSALIAVFSLPIPSSSSSLIFLGLATKQKIFFVVELVHSLHLDFF